MKEDEEYPSELHFPSYQGPSGYKFLDDNEYLKITPRDKDILVLSSDGRGFIYDKWEDFPKLFPKKYNWVYSKNNCEVDRLFSVFPRDANWEIVTYTNVFMPGFEVHWIPSQAVIRITFGNDPKSSRYLINVASYLFDAYQPEGFEDLKLIVEKIRKFNKLVHFNPSSIAATMKDFILADVPNQFWLSGRLTGNDLDFSLCGYKGPRQETRFIGSMPHQQDNDLKKAFLRKLALLPSIAPRNISKIYRGTNLYEESHPGSTFEIQVTIPPNKYLFGPLPARTYTNITYPTSGEMQIIVPKPYVELCNKEKIPYKIVRSLQFLLKDTETRPFEDLCFVIEHIENTYKDELYPINLKALHVTLVGHMLSVHQEYLREDKLNPIMVPSQDYSPMIASAVESMVATQIWQYAEGRQDTSISVDGSAGTAFSCNSDMKHSDPGDMFYFSAHIKDKPGETHYRELAYQHRDEPIIEIYTPKKNSFGSSWSRPSQIGRMVHDKTRIIPSAGSRKLEHPITRIGELLEGSVSCIPLSVEEAFADEERMYPLRRRPDRS